MGRVGLSEEGNELVVLLEERSDLAAMQAAFRGTPGSVDPSGGKGPDEALDLYCVPFARLADACALWTAGFSWEGPAMAAFLDRLVPLARGRFA
jgi:hypothetical protein